MRKKKGEEKVVEKERTEVSMLLRRPVPMRHRHLEHNSPMHKRRPSLDEGFASLQADQIVEAEELEEASETLEGPEGDGGVGKVADGRGVCVYETRSQSGAEKGR